MGKAMQKFTAGHFEDFKLLSKIQYKLNAHPRERANLVSLYHCNRSGIKGAGRVDVIHARNLTTGAVSAHYGLVSRCHSSWICPVCAVRNFTLQAGTISKLLERRGEQGYKAFMLTATIPHRREQSAQELIDLLKSCKRKMRGTAAYKFQRKLKIQGTITATECTYGFHGFHFHQHILFLIPAENWAEVEKFAATYKECWERAIGTVTGVPYDALKTNQYNPTESVFLSRTKRGEVLNVTDGRYVCDFGYELAKCATWADRKIRGRSMFELADSDDPHDFDLFLEYALATKGYARIVYSNKLRREANQLYESEKKTCDANIAKEVAASFCTSDWQLICESEIDTAKNHRYEILQACIDGGIDAITEYCIAEKIPIPAAPVAQYAETA